MNPPDQHCARDWANQLIFTPAQLSLDQVDATLARMMQGADYADAYFQYVKSESWGLEEGLVKNANFSIEQGVGLRSINGEQAALAYTDDCRAESIALAADKIIGAQKMGQGGRINANNANAKTLLAPPTTLYTPLDPSSGLSSDDKVGLLQWVDETARRSSLHITQVMSSLSASFEVVVIINSEGEKLCDVRPLVRFNLTVIAEKDGRREIGSAGGGGRWSLAEMTRERLSEWIREAVMQAETNLVARPTPAGEMTVVLGAGWPGILLHEAIGHGFEGDFTRKGSSVFADKIGQRVAAQGVTVIDDGTLAQRRGSLHMDDEGTPSGQTVLIEEGIVRGFMQDRLNAQLSGVARTGNGRRESYAHLPMPRMTNTYMLAGKYTHDEIIASVQEGIYCSSFAGGQVDITNGKFVFSANNAQRIENGKLTYPLKGATLIGSGAQSLQKISMIGNNLQFDSGVGTCGKEGQSVPVGVGQPTLRLEKMVVGGTEHA